MKKKNTVCFSDGDRSADLELCVFCKHMEDIRYSGECEHYFDKYDDCSCSEVIKVDDVSARLFEALRVRSAN